MLQIVCACKKLVEVVDREVSHHETLDGTPCPASGMRYVSKKVSSGYAGAPSFEVLAEKSWPCPICGEHEVGMALVKKAGGDPILN